jgi:HD-like signal output (HDOD) protein
MLNEKAKLKLERIRELPTIPHIMSEVLNAIEDPDINAPRLAKIIEKDQALAAKILKAANSPLYGFVKKISTIDLAVVVMGLTTIKEIVLSLVVQKFFKKIDQKIFNVKRFWEYSLFCATTSRLMARKLGYKLAGEAFVAGLMHDIGILVLVEYFTGDYKKIFNTSYNAKISEIEAENKILGFTHSEIGYWLANKWNLPDKLSNAILNHHIHYTKFKDQKELAKELVDFKEIDQPLTAIVSLSEWFAFIMGKMEWLPVYEDFELYLSKEVFEDISEDDIFEPDSAFEILKKEIEDEYEKASIFNEL